VTDAANVQAHPSVKQLLMTRLSDVGDGLESTRTAIAVALAYAQEIAEALRLLDRPQQLEPSSATSGGQGASAGGVLGGARSSTQGEGALLMVVGRGMQRVCAIVAALEADMDAGEAGYAGVSRQEGSGTGKEERPGIAAGIAHCAGHVPEPEAVHCGVDLGGHGVDTAAKWVLL
jgi:hypothetical protein